ncbi:MAG: transposase [Immundisolibacteraceae bacterium]|nr:transposase [Immundisolibacteraceae bacterium]
MVSLARRKPFTADNALKTFGDGDLLIQWKKPKHRRDAAYSDQQWRALPEYLTLRQIKVVITQPGFRGAIFHIVTTLLDPQKYPADQIIELYRQRWDVELFFRDIKTTLGMDILRCKTPEMVRKEIVMHWIVYNCIRWLMNQASETSKAAVRRLSFTASVQAIRQWEPLMLQAKNNLEEQRRLVTHLRTVIAEKVVLDRPDRGEPRAVKRRPKSYQLMTVPRHEMMQQTHQGKYGAQGA